MAKLILSLDGQVLGEFALDKERMTIGRRPGNDIRIDNLAVSGEHATVTTILNDSFLQDLDSTNGTLVNGQPIKKHVLQDGDEVQIGKHMLRYENPRASTQSASEFEKTMVIRRPEGLAESLAAPPSAPGDTQPMTAGRPAPAVALQPAAQPATSPLRPAALQILTGTNAGKELEITKTLTSLGKPGVQVAVITRRPHGYFITHVQGDVHPRVNGQLIDAHPHLLNDHDIVELAGVKMEFYLK
jgi:pSer/pThr/pTyr-binding forkhead associated (FHA) protein